MDDRFIRRIVTCDEKLAYYRNTDPSKQGSVLVNVPKDIVKKWFGQRVMYVSGIIAFIQFLHVTSYKTNF